jgi:hypothetical protein
MNSSPLCNALDHPALKKVVAAIYPACLWGAGSAPGLDGIREPTPMYIREVEYLVASFELGDFRSNLRCHHDRPPTQPVEIVLRSTRQRCR